MSKALYIKAIFGMIKGMNVRDLQKIYFLLKGMLGETEGGEEHVSKD